MWQASGRQVAGKHVPVAGRWRANASRWRADACRRWANCCLHLMAGRWQVDIWLGNAWQILPYKKKEEEPSPSARDLGGGRQTDIAQREDRRIGRNDRGICRGSVSPIDIASPPSEWFNSTLCSDIPATLQPIDITQSGQCSIGFGVSLSVFYHTAGYS